MADQKISALTSYTTPQATDVLPIVDTSNTATKKVALSDFYNTLSSLFRLKDFTDVTKKVAFDISNITTGTTRTWAFPDVASTFVGTDNIATLTNKTLGTGTKINTSGSDGTGATYYRDASGNYVPVAIGANGTIYQSNGSTPTWAANPAAVNASTTVNGTVEAATAAELTAGTPTGSTGAVLAITPDIIAAATPAYNLTNATNVKPTVALSGTASASISGTAVNTTQNIDTSVTTAIIAKTITVSFYLKGFSGAGTPSYSSGTAIFDGTTCRSVFYTNQNTTTNGYVWPPTVGSSSPVAGGGGAGNGQWAMSIQSLSATTFTFRLSYTQGTTFNGGDYSCVVSATS